MGPVEHDLTEKELIDAHRSKMFQILNDQKPLGPVTEERIQLLLKCARHGLCVGLLNGEISEAQFAEMVAILERSS